MQPSKADIADFLAFAPEADAGTAFLFLEVPTTHCKARARLTIPRLLTLRAWPDCEFHQ